MDKPGNWERTENLIGNIKRLVVGSIEDEAWRNTIHLIYQENLGEIIKAGLDNHGQFFSYEC